MAGHVEVLVAVAHGAEGLLAAVVRDEEGDLLLTGSLSFGGGTLLDADHFVAVEEFPDHVVTGGLLPDGAVVVDVRDDQGRTYDVACDDGAWVCVMPADGRCPVPSVVFRDHAGAEVRRAS